MLCDEDLEVVGFVKDVQCEEHENSVVNYRSSLICDSRIVWSS